MSNDVDLKATVANRNMSAGRALRATLSGSEVTRMAKVRFLVEFAKLGILGPSAKKAEISRVTVFQWKEKDPQFKRLYDEAYAYSIELLEQEARRRATKGVKKPIFFQGQECGTVQVFSDQLLIFLLKAAKPDTYRENQDKRPDEGGDDSIQVHLPANTREIVAEPTPAVLGDEPAPAPEVEPEPVVGLEALLEPDEDEVEDEED
jgi:hypothetical protein